MTDRDETDRWMDVLAGKAEPTDPDTQAAARLRRALKADQTMDNALDDAASTRIMNMLRAKGAFEDSAPEPAPAPSWLNRALAWLWPADSGQSMTGRYAAVATLAMAAVVVPGLVGQQEPNAVVQGDAPADIKAPSKPGQGATDEVAASAAVVYAQQPEAASQKVVALLQRHGVAAQVTAQQANRTVTATVPDALMGPVNADLMAVGLSLPANGRLVLRFVVTP